MIRTRVTTVICPKCGAEMYSRARHDYHGCRCGTTIDGGFDYLKVGWPNECEPPKTRTRYVVATKRQLFDDWNTQQDKFGFIKSKGV